MTSNMRIVETRQQLGLLIKTNPLQRLADAGSGLPGTTTGRRSSGLLPPCKTATLPQC
jgi:hypothetical protein